MEKTAATISTIALTSTLLAVGASTAQAFPEETTESVSAAAAAAERVPAGGTVRIRAGAPNSTVMGNLTVTSPADRGFTTAYPCLDGLPTDAQGRPNASVNNYVANQTTPNFAAVKTDSNGDICIYTSTATHLIWDQVAETNQFASDTPQRLLDTREIGDKQRLGAGKVIKVRTGHSNATAMGNLTVTGPQGRGFTTAYPCNMERPNASVNNYVANQTTPNFAAVKTDSNGDICIYTTAAAHIIWDQVLTTSRTPAIPAVRLLDTRLPNNGKEVSTATVTVDGGTGFTTATQQGKPVEMTIKNATKGKWLSVYVGEEGQEPPLLGTGPNIASSVRIYDATGTLVHNYTPDQYYQFEFLVPNNAVLPLTAEIVSTIKATYGLKVTTPKTYRALTYGASKISVNHDRPGQTLHIPLDGVQNGDDVRLISDGWASFDLYDAAGRKYSFTSGGALSQTEFWHKLTIPDNAQGPFVLHTANLNGPLPNKGDTEWDATTPYTLRMLKIDNTQQSVTVNGATEEINLEPFQTVTVTLDSVKNRETVNVYLETIPNNPASPEGRNYAEFFDANGKRIGDLSISTDWGWWIQGNQKPFIGKTTFTVPETTALPISMKFTQGEQNSIGKFKLTVSTPQQFTTEANGNPIRVSTTRPGQTIKINTKNILRNDDVTVHIKRLDDTTSTIWPLGSIYAQDANLRRGTPYDLFGGTAEYKFTVNTEDLFFTDGFEAPPYITLPLALMLDPDGDAEHEITITTIPSSDTTLTAETCFVFKHMLTTEAKQNSDALSAAMKNPSEENLNNLNPAIERLELSSDMYYQYNFPVLGEVAQKSADSMKALQANPDSINDKNSEFWKLSEEIFEITLLNLYGNEMQTLSTTCGIDTGSGGGIEIS